MSELSSAPPAPNAAPAFPAVSEVVEIPLDALEPDPFQPRSAFDERAIRELARSIEQHGLLQPLLVRPMQGPGSQGRFWIVAGERRYRAAQLLGLKRLPCRIRAYANLAAAVVALAENVHREDLSELDKAEALLRIKTLTDQTWDEVAELVKLSRDYVKRLAGLVKLEPAVQQWVRAGRISVRTAIALRPLPPREQIAMAERVLAEGLTAEQVRREVRERRPRGRRRVSDPAGGADAPPRAEPTPASLAEAVAVIRAIDAWIDGREWRPGRLTGKQRAELEALHEAVSLLHQHLLALRCSLRTEETVAERLRKAPLPF